MSPERHTDDDRSIRRIGSIVTAPFRNWERARFLFLTQDFRRVD